MNRYFICLFFSAMAGRVVREGELSLDRVISLATGISNGVRRMVILGATFFPVNECSSYVLVL